MLPATPTSTISKRRIPPTWLMGMCGGASYGLVSGFIIYTMPQALAAQHVPETRITYITAVADSPMVFIFLLSPILDVWLSRRSYASVLTTVAAFLVGISVTSLRHLPLLTLASVTGASAINLAYFAVGGWFSTVSPKEAENQLSAWLTVGIFAGAGAMAVFGGELVRHFSPTLAGILLASLVLIPISILPWIPSPGPDRRLAAESFRAFFADVFALLRRRQVLIALALFLAPCGSFALTNMVAGLGNDFRASPRMVGTLCGVGGAVAGSCGSLLLPTLAKGLSLRYLYLAIGACGGVFTLSLILLPRTPAVFALAAIGEVLAQALATTCCTAICFEVIGQDNPLAATNFAVLSSAYCVPITYMLVVDGWGYGLHGVAGAFAVDAVLGIGACVVMASVLSLCRTNLAEAGRKMKAL